MQDCSRLPHHTFRRLPQSMPEAQNGHVPVCLVSGSARSYSPASGQRSAQGGPSGMLPMPMGSGQHSGQDWDAVGGGAGVRSSGRLLQQQGSAHPEQQPLPMPALEKRPSDLLHAFAQVAHLLSARHVYQATNDMPLRSTLVFQALFLKPLVHCAKCGRRCSLRHLLGSLRSSPRFVNTCCIDCTPVIACARLFTIR